jgi:hypothetical protein
MGLRFTPDRAVYDPRHRWVRFFARDQLLLVPCAVTRKALTAAAIAAALDRDSPLYVYSKVKKQVQAVAADKYQAHDLEEGGMVVVRKRDLLPKGRTGPLFPQPPAG